MTTVLRLIRRPEIDQHRTALCAWLKANGVHPDHVADRWLSIEHDDEQTIIRYRAYKLTADGHRIVDPDDCNQLWAEECTTPLTVELALPPAVPEPDREATA